jgi:hypothetical protein
MELLVKKMRFNKKEEKRKKKKKKKNLFKVYSRLRKTHLLRIKFLFLTNINKILK